MTDFAHSAAGRSRGRLSCRTAARNCGFVFPDDEALVQAEFQTTCRSRSTWRSRPTIRRIRFRISASTTKPFYLNSEDTYKSGLPEANFVFYRSYGDPQPIRMLAMRSLGKVTLKWQINGDADDPQRIDRVGRGARSTAWHEPLLPRRQRLCVTGRPRRRRPGLVRGRRQDEPFLHVPRSQRERKQRAGPLSGGLLRRVAGRRRTRPAPHYLGYYLDALAANGIESDVYDVDAKAATLRYARDAVPLRRGHLVHGRRHRHA